jgi:hypothetical protein
MNAVDHAIQGRHKDPLAQEISVLCLVMYTGGRNNRKKTILYFTFVMLFKLLIN